MSRGSGLVPLRPLTVGEIYDGSIRAIRGNPVTLGGFAAVVVAVFSLIALLPQAAILTSLASTGVFDGDFAQTADTGQISQVLSQSGLSALIAVLQYVAGTALVSGLVVIAVDAAVRGQILHTPELLARGRRKLLPMIGLSLVVVLGATLAFLVCLVPGLVFIPIASGMAAVLLVIGALAGSVLTLALVLSRWAVASPVLLLEDAPIVRSLRRSSRLVKGSSWRVFWIGVLTAIVAGVIRGIFAVPFSVVAGLAGPTAGTGSFGQTVVQLLITNAGTIIAGAVVLPFSGGVTALLYLDLRIRREGLDVELLRSQQL